MATTSFLFVRQFSWYGVHCGEQRYIQSIQSHMEDQPSTPNFPRIFQTIRVMRAGCSVERIYNRVAMLPYSVKFPLRKWIRQIFRTHILGYLILGKDYIFGKSGSKCQGWFLGCWFWKQDGCQPSHWKRKY